MKTAQTPQLLTATEKFQTAKKALLVLHGDKTPTMRSEPLTSEETTLLKKAKQKGVVLTAEEETQLKQVQDKLSDRKKQEKNSISFSHEEVSLLKEAFAKFSFSGTNQQRMKDFLYINADTSRCTTSLANLYEDIVALSAYFSKETQQHNYRYQNIKYSASRLEALCQSDNPQESLEKATNFIATHAAWNSKQPIHDLFLFTIPSDAEKWSPKHWYPAIMAQRRLLKFVGCADIIEQHTDFAAYDAACKELEELHTKRTNLQNAYNAKKKKSTSTSAEKEAYDAILEKCNQDLEKCNQDHSAALQRKEQHALSEKNIQEILTREAYPNSLTIESLELSEKKKGELRKFTALAVENSITTEAYEKGFKILSDPDLKTTDRIPDITIDGKDLGEELSNFYMVKLQPGDHRGLLLGKLSHCCQSIGEESTVCVEAGMQENGAGFVAVFKKSKADIIDPQNDRLVAQSFTWFGNSQPTSNELVFDSFERRGNENNKLLAFYIRFAQIALREHGVTKVSVGTGGNTPEFVSITGTPTPGSLYGDSNTQYLLASSQYPDLAAYLATPLQPITDKIEALKQLPPHYPISNLAELLLNQCMVEADTNANTCKLITHLLNSSLQADLSAKFLVDFTIRAVKNKRDDILDLILSSPVADKIPGDGEDGLGNLLLHVSRIASNKERKDRARSIILASPHAKKIPSTGEYGTTKSQATSISIDIAASEHDTLHEDQIIESMRSVDFHPALYDASPIPALARRGFIKAILAMLETGTMDETSKKYRIGMTISTLAERHSSIDSAIILARSKHVENLPLGNNPICKTYSIYSIIQSCCKESSIPLDYCRKTVALFQAIFSHKTHAYEFELYYKKAPIDALLEQILISTAPSGMLEALTESDYFPSKDYAVAYIVLSFFNNLQKCRYESPYSDKYKSRLRDILSCSTIVTIKDIEDKDLPEIVAIVVAHVTEKLNFSLLPTCLEKILMSEGIYYDKKQQNITFCGKRDTVTLPLAYILPDPEHQKIFTNKFKQLEEELPKPSSLLLHGEVHRFDDFCRNSRDIF